MSLMYRFRRGSRTEPETVTVPDGYQVAIVKPSPHPAFNRAESGFWLADFGPQEHLEPGFKTVENIIKDDPRSSIIWVLQKGLLDYWAADALRMAELLRRFFRVQRFRVDQGWAGKEMLSYWPAGPFKLSDLFQPNPQVQQSRISDIVVVAEASAKAQALMALLSSIGLSTYTPGPNDEIFVEIHTPDKIIVGVPGSRISPSSDQTLPQLHLEREQIQRSPDVTAKLLKIEEQELAHIEKAIQAATPFTSRFLGSQAKNSPPLLSALMEQYFHNQDPKLYTQFVEAFLGSKVGAQMSGGVKGVEDQHTSTRENPLTIAQATSSDGHNRILAYADPPLYAMRFGEKYNSLIDGDQILKIVVSIPDCAGVHINSALRKSSILIQRELAIAILKL